MASAEVLPPRRRRRGQGSAAKYRAPPSDGQHELRPQVGFLPQLAAQRADRDEAGRGRDASAVGFGGGGTYGSQEHIGRLESQLAAAQKEIERLRMRLKQSDERNRATEAKMNDQGALLLRESTRHERFATLIKAAEAENKRLAKRLAQTDRRTADDIRQLELTISSMEEECHSLRIERDAMEEELGRERNRATQHEFAAKRQTMDHGALVKALSVTKEEKDAAASRLRVVQEELAAAQGSVAEMVSRIEEMDAESARLRADLAETDTTASAQLSQLEEELLGERSSLRQATGALRSLEAEHEQDKDHWQRQQLALRAEIANAEKNGAWQQSSLLSILQQERGEEEQQPATNADGSPRAPEPEPEPEPEPKPEGERASGVGDEALQVWEDAFKKFDVSATHTAHMGSGAMSDSGDRLSGRLTAMAPSQSPS